MGERGKRLLAFETSGPGLHVRVGPGAWKAPDTKKETHTMEQDSNGFTLTKPELAALCAHAMKDETRPHLCGVAIWPNGAIVSTDGHRLLLGRKANPGGPLNPALDLAEPVVIPLESLRAVVKACKAKDSIRLEVTSTGAVATTGPASFKLDYFTGNRPPPYDQVMPAIWPGSPCGAPCIEASFFADLAPLASSFRDSKACGIVVSNNGSELEPSTVRFEGSDDWTAVLMPRRGGPSWSYDPKWGMEDKRAA
jgi:hypothetical protein